MTLEILLVDDEADAEELFRQQFRRELRRGDMALAFAQSGAEALRLLAAEDPPSVLVVLSDINMPGMSGLDLLGEVKRRWPALPVIMISAYGDKGTEADVCNRGARGLLAKPVDFGRLRGALSQLAGTEPA